MKVAERGNYLEFLDLKLKWEDDKITVDVYCKTITSFKYVLPTTFYPRKIINNIPHDTALRLRQICDSDGKFKHQSKEYKNYLITRDYHPELVDKQFKKVERTSRHNARKKNAKRKEVGKVKFIATFNPALPGIEGLIKKHVHYLDSDKVLKKVFPNGKFSVINKRNKNPKEMVAPSLYPKPSIKSNRTIVSCNKSDICKNFLITDSKFRCTVTGKTYFIKSNLSCDSCNVIYLITCFICREQYVVPAINFKQRFRIHKSDIKTNKDRCETALHFNNKCCSPNNKHAYSKIQIIEQVFNNN